MATRPVQEMADTSAALKAAREVQADTLAPELFRQSNEWFLRAKREYKLKNFQLAAEYSRKAKFFAEQAEFESMRNGAKRVEYSAPDPLSNQAIVSGSASESPPPPDTVKAPVDAPAPFVPGADGGTPAGGGYDSYPDTSIAIDPTAGTGGAMGATGATGGATGQP